MLKELKINYTINQKIETRQGSVLEFSQDKTELQLLCVGRYIFTMGNFVSSLFFGDETTKRDDRRLSYIIFVALYEMQLL